MVTDEYRAAAANKRKAAKGNEKLLEKKVIADVEEGFVGSSKNIKYQQLMKDGAVCDNTILKNKRIFFS